MRARAVGLVGPRGGRDTRHPRLVGRIGRRHVGDRPWRAVARATSHTFTQIDVPFAGATLTEAAGINGAGQIVGSFQDAVALQGFLDSGGVFTGIVAQSPRSRCSSRIPTASTAPARSSGSTPTAAASITGSWTSAGCSRRSTCRGPATPTPTASTAPARSSGSTTAAATTRLPGQRRGLHDHRRAGGQLAPRPSASTTPARSSGTTPTQRRRPRLPGRRRGLHDHRRAGGQLDPAFGINGAGQIVGGYFDSSGDGHGFLDVGGAFTTIDVPGAGSTAALGINGAGQMPARSADYWQAGAGAAAFASIKSLKFRDPRFRR